MSTRAWSAIVLAAAFWASVGSVLPLSTAGSTSITQAWRCSGVVASSRILASTCSGLAVMPSVVARPAWIRVSIRRSRTVGTSWSLWPCCWIVWIWA